MPGVLKPIDDKTVYEMPTSTGATRKMRRVGTLEFTLQGPADEADSPSSKSAPTRVAVRAFSDLTSGTETYAAGRFMDLGRNRTGIYEVDFNRAYIPYCYYNPTYECPYPPAENRLKIPIRAGEDEVEKSDVSDAARAIVFDFDGVIANSEPLHFRGYRDVLADDGVPLTEPDYYARYLGFDDVGAFEAIGARARRRVERRATSRIWSRARRCGSRSSSATSRCCFPAPPTRSAAPPAAVPIAIASGARGDEIRRVLVREQSARLLHRDRRRRGHAGQQAGAGSVSARVGTARTPRCGDRAARVRVRRDRGLALGPGVGARRGTAHGCRDQHLSGADELVADLTIASLEALDLDSLSPALSPNSGSHSRTQSNSLDSGRFIDGI